MNRLLLTCFLTLTLMLLLSPPLAMGQTAADVSDFEVVVVGSEPEAIAAAVAAAEEGARTLLVSEEERLGGLFVLGQLNVLDLRTQPVNLQQGLFERWWQMVGGGHSFDVPRAEAAFARLLEESGVEVVLGVPTPAPLMDGRRVTGVRVGEVAYPARQVIDGTADMEFAAAAGAPHTVGFESIGLEERMVDTLVFRIDGVDWAGLGRAVRERGHSYATIDDRVAWGHFGGIPARYKPMESGLRLRGLNLGLQDDGSVLVNALLIHGIDPFDPESRAEGRARAQQEAARVVEYLAAELPGFSRARFAGTAPRLYIRESRHLTALCTLTVDDVLDNRVTERDVAAGGYPLDVQVLTENDTGYVFGTPEVYGVRLCVNVPQELDGLWVVGKSAGYDPIAASSARVVPFGMNVAEAVGVAAALAVDRGRTPAQVAGDEAAIREVRERLLQRGAYLARVGPREPAGPHDHPHYDAYRLMLSRGLALGGYSNTPELDSPTTALSYLYLLSNVLTRFFGAPQAGKDLVAEVGLPEGPLTSELGATFSRRASCHLGDCLEPGAVLAAAGVGSSSAATLTRGDGYALAAALIEDLSSRGFGVVEAARQGTDRTAATGFSGSE